MLSQFKAFRFMRVFTFKEIIIKFFSSNAGFNLKKSKTLEEILLTDSESVVKVKPPYVNDIIYLYTCSFVILISASLRIMDFSTEV